MNFIDILAWLMFAGFILVMACLAMGARCDRERRAGGEEEDHD